MKIERHQSEQYQGCVVEINVLLGCVLESKVLLGCVVEII